LKCEEQSCNWLYSSTFPQPKIKNEEEKKSGLSGPATFALWQLQLLLPSACHSMRHGTHQKSPGLFRRQVGKAVAAARIDAGVIIDTVDDCFLYIDWHFSQPRFSHSARSPIFPHFPAFPAGALLRNVATFAN